MRRLAVAIAVLALGAVAPAAGAATPSQARDAAERALLQGAAALNPQPHAFGSAAQRRRFRPAISIHRLRRALPPRARVGQGVQRAKNRRVGRRTFLFWGDYAPGAGFVHPSRLALVDARSGKVFRTQDLSWWPEVNGKRVFTKSRGRLVERRGRGSARAAVVPGLKNDCIVTIGDRTDPHFLKGIAAITRMGNRHGMPVASAKRVRDLGPKIDELAKRNPPCTDVMIYIGAHGWAPQNSNVKLPNGDPVAKSDKARVMIKSTAPAVEETLDLDDVKKVVHDRPTLTFKLVVEACFSGRWTLLMAEPNVRITLTSARANEVTFLAVTHAQRGVQVDGNLRWEEGAPVGTPDGPDDPPPFTKGFIQAFDDWADSPGNQNGELGAALGYAGTHRDGDRARRLGWQSGRTDDRTDERPHAPLPTPSVSFTVNVSSSYRHLGVGSSETCWGVQTSPPRPNAQVTVNVTGPGVVSQPQPAITDANGFVLVRAPINELGNYNATVNVLAQDGVPASGNGQVIVTAADGTCPP